jgi:hypothetical protein
VETPPQSTCGQLLLLINPSSYYAQPQANTSTTITRHTKNGEKKQTMQSDSQLCQSCPILATVPISDAILQEVYSSDQAMYPVNLPYSRLHSWVAATTPSLSMSFVFQDPQASSASAMSYSDLAESGCTNPSTDSNPDPSSELTGSSTSFTSAAVQSSDGKIAVAGVIIVLPLLKHHWLDLLQGKLKESEIDPVTMFPKEQERAEQVEVGLHVYHIERFAVPRREKQDWKSALKGKKFAEFALDEVMGRVEREKRRWRVLGQSGRLLSHALFGGLTSV